MEQSANENNRKDDCGDNENGNEEPTTSKADFNDSLRNVYNANDSVTLDFNSADDVRQAMKAIMADKMSHPSDDDSCSTMKKNHVDDKISKRNEAFTQINEDKNIENLNECKTDSSNDLNKTQPVVMKQQDSKQIRKRPARPPKSRPKRHKKAGTQGFYWGKFANLVFMERCYRSGSSSEDDSLFFL